MQIRPRLHRTRQDAFRRVIKSRLSGAGRIWEQVNSDRQSVVSVLCPLCEQRESRIMISDTRASRFQQTRFLGRIHPLTEKQKTRRQESIKIRVG